MPRAKRPLKEADPNAEAPSSKSSKGNNKQKQKQKQQQSPDAADEVPSPDVAASQVVEIVDENSPAAKKASNDDNVDEVDICHSCQLKVD